MKLKNYLENPNFSIFVTLFHFIRLQIFLWTWSLLGNNNPKFVYPKLIHHNRSHAIAYSTALVGTKLACFAIMINCSRFLIVIWSKNEHTFFKTVIGLLVVKVDWVLRYILGVDFDFWSFNLVLINLEHKVFVTLFSRILCQ